MGYDKLRALVVDDSTHTRQLIRSVLGATGMQIEESSNGAAALERIELLPVDIVLVDYEMRPVNGIEFTRRVRENRNPIIRDVGILMMTGHADQQHVLQAREARIDGFISKPLSLSSILGRTENVLNRSLQRLAAARG